MTTTHYFKAGSPDKAACGARGCYVRVHECPAFVDCSSCARHTRFKAASADYWARHHAREQAKADAHAALVASLS